MSPQYVEFTNIVPEYPKTHLKGYATVISLDDSVLNPTAIDELRKGFQYSLCDGRGKRFINHVEFFGIKGELEVSMEHSMRQCAGVKVCEFLPEEMKKPHTEVDPEGHTWAELLGAQEQAEAFTFNAQVETLYEQYENQLCERTSFNGRDVCGGRTVIRSFAPKATYSSLNRLFIGCEKYRGREKGHTFFNLQQYDPIAILQMWGKERCLVHDDIIEDLGITWPNNLNGNLFQLKKFIDW